MNLESLYLTVVSNLAGIVSVAISAVAVFVAVLAYRRTGRYERSEHKPRLQLANSDFSLTGGLTYSAVIENKGVKPVDIRGVAIAHSSADGPKKRIHDIVRGPFYLGAGESEQVTCHRSWAEVEKMRQEAQPLECMFYLCIAYLTAEGDDVKIYHALGGYDKDGTEYRVLHVGPTLG